MLCASVTHALTNVNVFYYPNTDCKTTWSDGNGLVRGSKNNQCYGLDDGRRYTDLEEEEKYRSNCITGAEYQMQSGASKETILSENISY
jgi:hypothetical protein